MQPIPNTVRQRIISACLASFMNVSLMPMLYAHLPARRWRLKVNIRVKKDSGRCCGKLFIGSNTGYLPDPEF